MFKKNTNQIIFYGLIILIFLIFITINVIQTLKAKNLKINELSNQISENDEYYNYLVSEVFNNESIVINNVNVFLDGTNDTINMEEFVSSRDQPTLVFDFSGNSCGSCVDFCIEKLNEHLSEFFLTQRIEIFYSDRRGERVFENKNPYVISSGFELGIPFREKHSLPFFYILDKDMTIRMSFIPSTSKPKLTDNYLKIIKKRMFN